MLNEKCMEAQTQEVGKLHVVLSQTSVSLVSSKEEAAKSSTPFDGVQNVKAKISVQADDDEGPVHFCEVVSLLASKRTRLRQGGRVAKRAFFPLDPDSPHKHAWDIFVVMLLISALFLGPYNLAFAEDSQPGEAMTTMEILDVFIDCTFCIDIAFTFLTAYLKDGVYVSTASNSSQSAISKAGFGSICPAACRGTNSSGILRRRLTLVLLNWAR